MSHNLTDVASSEAILAAIAIPIGSLNTLITLFIIVGIVRFSIKGTLESRILFEVQSMISSNLGFLIKSQHEVKSNEIPTIEIQDSTKIGIGAKNHLHVSWHCHFY